MTEAVGDVGDEVEIFAFLTAKESVNGVDDNLYYIYVLPLIETADVVGLCHLALMEDKVDGTGMVFHEEPVAHVLSFAIYGEWLAVTDIVDEEWYQLLGELVRTIVVGAVGDDGRHTVGVVIGSDKMVAACLAAE